MLLRVQVDLFVTLKAGRNFVRREDVYARYTAPPTPDEFLGDISGRAADIQDFGDFGNELRIGADEGMRAVRVHFGRVQPMPIRRIIENNFRMKSHVIEQIVLLKKEFEASLDNILRIAQTVYMTNLVTISRRNINLDDLHVILDELEKDLGVKVKIVGVKGEPDGRKGSGGICAITRVPFAEMNAGQPVLQIGKDPITDVLVKRHAAADR